MKLKLLDRQEIIPAKLEAQKTAYFEDLHSVIDLVASYGAQELPGHTGSDNNIELRREIDELQRALKSDAPLSPLVGRLYEQRKGEGNISPQLTDTGERVKKLKQQKEQDQELIDASKEDLILSIRKNATWYDNVRFRLDAGVKGLFPDSLQFFSLLNSIGCEQETDPNDLLLDETIQLSLELTVLLSEISDLPDREQSERLNAKGFPVDISWYEKPFKSMPKRLQSLRDTAEAYKKLIGAVDDYRRHLNGQGIDDRIYEAEKELAKGLIEENGRIIGENETNLHRHDDETIQLMDDEEHTARELANGVFNAVLEKVGTMLEVMKDHDMAAARVAFIKVFLDALPSDENEIQAFTKLIPAVLTDTPDTPQQDHEIIKGVRDDLSELYQPLAERFEKTPRKIVARAMVRSASDDKRRAAAIQRDEKKEQFQALAKMASLMTEKGIDEWVATIDRQIIGTELQPIFTKTLLDYWTAAKTAVHAKAVLEEMKKQYREEERAALSLKAQQLQKLDAASGEDSMKVWVQERLDDVEGEFVLEYEARIKAQEARLEELTQNNNDDAAAYSEAELESGRLLFVIDKLNNGYFRDEAGEEILLTKEEQRKLENGEALDGDATMGINAAREAYRKQYQAKFKAMIDEQRAGIESTWEIKKAVYKSRIAAQKRRAQEYERQIPVWERKVQLVAETLSRQVSLGRHLQAVSGMIRSRVRTVSDALDQKISDKLLLLENSDKGADTKAIAKIIKDVEGKKSPDDQVRHWMDTFNIALPEVSLGTPKEVAEALLSTTTKTAQERAKVGVGGEKDLAQDLLNIIEAKLPN
ncbi:MAG: hypothetical protein Q8O95_02100 [bacterium]|nr:hypothetical protein [bacterium]